MQRRSTLSGLWGGLWGGSHCVAGRGAHSSVKFLHVRGAWFGYSSMVKSPIVVLNVTSSTMVAGASVGHALSQKRLAEVLGYSTALASS